MVLTACFMAALWLLWLMLMVLLPELHHNSFPF